MITQTIIDWLTDSLTWIIGLIPSLPQSVASVINGATAGLSSLGSLVSNLSPIIPWNVLFVSAGAYFAVVMVMWGIVLVQKIISMVSGGGGAV